MTQAIKFYADDSIPDAVIEQLRQHKVDVLRYQFAEMGVDAAAHLDFANKQGRVLITPDIDFLKLDEAWAAKGKGHAGIVYITPWWQDDLNVVMTGLLLIHTALTLEEMRNQVEYL